VRSVVKLIFLLLDYWLGIYRQWMRRAFLQFFKNRVADALRIAAQLRIPEPQRLDAERLQKHLALFVMLSLVGETVLAAVQLEVQHRLFAKEIQIVNADGMLAAKFIAAETAVTQPAPHEFFRPSFLFAKLAGAFDIGHEVRIKYPVKN
jgi:hypothetical protein